MRQAILIALACAACGRLGFDASAVDASAAPDVLLAHDEDEDGVADVDDVCPHRGGTQADSDGDRIGDDCDPEPTNPRQRRLLFATMQAGDQPLTLEAGTWTQLTDAIRFDGNGFAALRRDGTLGSVRMAIGVDIEAVLGTNLQHQISLGARSTTVPEYSVELNEAQAISQAAITEYEVGFIPLAFRPLAMRMHPGRISLQGTYDLGMQTIVLDGGWDGEPYNLTANAPRYTGAGEVKININNLACQVRYLWIVEW